MGSVCPGHPAWRVRWPRPASPVAPWLPVLLCPEEVSPCPSVPEAWFPGVREWAWAVAELGSMCPLACCDSWKEKVARAQEHNPVGMQEAKAL